MKPKHAMTFQAGTVGVALALLAVVGRDEAAYATGAFLLVATALYVSYRVMTRTPFRPSLATENRSTHSWSISA